MPTTAAAKAAPAKPAVPAAAPAPAPVAFDPFALSLQDMAASKESAAGIGMTVGDTLNMLNKAVDAASSSSSSTMNTGAASSSAMNSNIPKAGQYGKKKKSVRWPEDDKIKTIKYVEKLVYGDEFGNEITTSVSNQDFQQHGTRAIFELRL